MTVTLSLSYLRYLCLFSFTVVISIHRAGIAPLYIQEGVKNDYRMAADAGVTLQGRRIMLLRFPNSIEQGLLFVHQNHSWHLATSRPSAGQSCPLWKNKSH